MRIVRSLVCGLVALAALGCSGDATSPVDQHFQVTFAQDSVQVYDATSPSCSGSLYCMAWTPTRATYAGELNVFAGAVTIDTVTFSGPALHLDSLANDLVELPRCGILELRATVHDGVMRGTWRQVLDCHGLTRVGTLLGSQLILADRAGR